MGASHRTAALLACLTILAAGLRVPFLGANSLWLDEAFSWQMQDLPIDEMVARTGSKATTHPPLYFLLLHAWTSLFGDGEFSLRLPAAVFGIATVPAIYLLVRDAVRLFGTGDSEEASGLLAAFLTAVSPLQILNSQQARGYSLTVLLLVLSSWTLLRALASPRPARFWATYVIICIAWVYTHYLAWLSVAAQGTFVLYVGLCRSTRADNGSAPAWRAGESFHGMRDILAFAGSTAALVAAYGPWWPRLLQQSDELRVSWPNARLGLSGHVHEIAETLLGTWASPKGLAGWWDWLCAGVLFAAIIWTALKGGMAGRYFCLLGIIPPLLLEVYSVLSIRGIFAVRYLSFAQPAWLACLAVGPFLFRHAMGRIAIVLLLVEISLWCIDRNWRVIGPSHQPGMRAAANYVAARRGRGEVVVADTPFAFHGALYYFREASFRPILCSPTKDRWSLRGAAHLKDEDLRLPEEILAQRPPGFWVLTTISYLESAVTPLEVPSEYHLSDRESFKQDYPWEHAIHVFHYSRVPAEQGQ